MRLSDEKPRRTGQRPESDARARRPVRWLATTLLALALPVGAVLPSAAQADVLVSNLSKGSRSTAAVGSSSGLRFTVAIGFETGSNTSGYTLTSIRAALSNAVPADGVRVSLFTASFNFPHTSLFTFDNPTISNGTKSFTAPANTILDPDRLYFLVFDSTAANGGYHVGATGSDSLTSAVAGWKLNADRTFRTSVGGVWLMTPATLRVEINGTVIPNAAGAPNVTGVPQAGRTLTADIGTMADDDGLPAFPSGFSFQWVRVDGTTETEIPGATSSTYRPTSADVGKTLKVRVSYTDSAGASEGPLKSDTTGAVVPARTACPNRSDWCAEMTVGRGSRIPVPLGFSDLGKFGDYGSLKPSTINHGKTVYRVNEIKSVVDSSAGTNTVAVTLNAFLPRGSIFNIGGTEFTADASSEQAGTGQYEWLVLSGFSWIEGQKVTVSMRVPPAVVTIAQAETDAVYGRDDLEFVVSRTLNTVSAVDVSVELTQYRTYLPDPALSQTVQIPANAESATLTIGASEYAELNEGIWTSRPSKIKAKVKNGPGYSVGSPASASVTMRIAMTVGFEEDGYRVDEGSGTVSVSFRATTGAELPRPTSRVEVQYETVEETATSPADFTGVSNSFFIEPEDFVHVPGRDWYSASHTVTQRIREDSDVEGDETFLLRLLKSPNNTREVVYVDDRGYRGVTCTPSSTCTTEITIVDNDGITQPTENPDWTLEGSYRTFAGTSSAHRRPTMSGTETAVRCLNGSRPFRLFDEDGIAVTGAITYSLHEAAPYAGFSGITQPSAVPGMFTIDDTGQIRTKVGVDYPNGQSPQGNLRTIYANVRATHTASNRYAEYRLGFTILHPNQTQFAANNPPCTSLQVSQEPLTAEFENLPESHDGSSPFSFRLSFSAEVTIVPASMRDHALLVSGGTVTGASRVDGRKDLWEFTVQPAGNGAVSILVPLDRACTETGALCTADGRKLSTAVPAQVVTGPPQDQQQAVALTASFENVPAEHDGSTVFTMRVRFSEALASVGARGRVERTLSATGGAVQRVNRVDQRRDLFEVPIQPSGHGAVTVSLPPSASCDIPDALCTPDNRPLSNAISVAVQGPPGLSVADAEVEEGPNAALAFAVTLGRAATGAVTVGYATANGSATAGSDYTATSGTLSFAAGVTEKTVSVPVIDDLHDEGDETLTLTLSNASGAWIEDGSATGTIENHDPLPTAFIARFGRATAEQVVQHVEERMAAPRERGFRARFAGRELRPGMEGDFALGFLSGFGQPLGASPMGGHPAGASAVGGAPMGPTTMGAHVSPHGVGAPGMAGGLPPAGGIAAAMPGHGPSTGHGGGFLGSLLPGGGLFSNSEFELNREQHGGVVSLWSRSSRSHFGGAEGALSLGGDVRTTMFGADYTRGALVVGLSVGRTLGLGSYSGPSAGQMTSSMTGFYPWVGYRVNDRVSVWGVTGYGTGALSLAPDGAATLETGLSMAMTAAGTRGELIGSRATGGFALAFKADALWVGAATGEVDGAAGRLSASEAGVTRVRTALEGSRGFTVGGRVLLTPSVEIGLRQDGGDAETGVGLDVGSGLVLTDALTGLSLDVRVRTLVVHQSAGFTERGMSFSFGWDPTPSSPLGLTARLSPSWGGSAMSGAEALWQGQMAYGSGSHQLAGSGGRLDGEVGYGLPVGSRFVGTPRVGLVSSEYGRDYRVGYGLGVLDTESLRFELGVDAHRRESPLEGGAEAGVRGGVTLGW